eukprot:1008294-Prymnesium_polylepis.3
MPVAASSGVLFVDVCSCEYLVAVLCGSFLSCEDGTAAGFASHISDIGCRVLCSCFGDAAQLDAGVCSGPLCERIGECCRRQQHRGLSHVDV